MDGRKFVMLFIYSFLLSMGSAQVFESKGSYCPPNALCKGEFEVKNKKWVDLIKTNPSDKALLLFSKKNGLPLEVLSNKKKVDGSYARWPLYCPKAKADHLQIVQDQVFVKRNEDGPLGGLIYDIKTRRPLLLYRFNRLGLPHFLLEKPLRAVFHHMSHGFYYFFSVGNKEVRPLRKTSIKKKWSVKFLESCPGFQNEKIFASKCYEISNEKKKYGVALIDQCEKK